MTVLLVVVGRVRGALAGAVDEYEARAGRYWKLEIVEVEAGASGRNPDARRVRTAEGERIVQRLPRDFDVVALTREGKPMGSVELARYLQDLAVQARAGVAFVIGGAFGLADDVLGRASRRVSLSALTMPHEMARLILVEQLYRAGTIARNEPYHKGVR